MNMEAESEIVNEKNEVLVMGTSERLIREVGEKTKGLVVSDAKSFDSIKKARTEMVSVRTSIDKALKVINKSHRDAITDNNTQAKALTAIAAEYEQPLQDQVKKWENIKEEEKRLNEEKEQARIAVYISAISDFRNLPVTYVNASIENIQGVINNYLNIDISEDTYEEYAIEARQVLNQTIETLTTMLDAAKEQEAEAERQAAAQVVLDEAQKILDEQREEQDKIALKRKSEQDAEALKLEEQRKEQQKEAEDRQKIQDEEALKLENERIEFERQKKVAEDKIESDRLEAEQKEIDIKLEAKRLQDEKDEQIRQENIRPDREKLVVFAGELDNIATPEVDSDEARAVILTAKRALASLSNDIIQKCENL